MRQLLSVLFIVLTFTALSLASRRDYSRISTNNFDEDFNDRVSNVGAASLDTSGPTIITFSDPNNGTCGIGNFRFQCLPDGHSQFDLDIPINLTVEVQQKLKIRDVYIWFGPQGTQPTTDYTNWGNSNISSGGVSYAIHNLRGFFYRTQITLRDIISILTNADGSFRTCFRIEVVVKVDRYCGFSNRPRAFRHSPEGCDFDYEAIYPATDAYFHVALNNDGSIDVNNDTLYFKGYCLDPTRSVYPNYNYKGQIYSSYDYEVLNSESGTFVEAPQNFPYVNYIANHESEYLSRFLSGHQCTWQDVQNAIWRVLFPNATSSNADLRTILTNTTEDCVQWIVDDAFSNGANYTPTCPGGKYLMIIFPITKDGGCNCTKDLETQLIAFPTGGSCLNKCAPKVCHDVIRAGRKICLTGNCAPLPSPSVSITSKPILPSESSTPVPSVSSTSAPSVSSTPAPSVSSTPAPSVSSTPAPSVSSTPAPSVSSTPAPSVSGTPAPSVSSTPAPSVSGTPAPSVSSTPAPSVSGTPAPSVSSTPAPSVSGTPAPSVSSTPAASVSGTPAPSQSNTPRPSRSVSSTPCPSRSNTPAPSQSRTSRPSRSVSSTPCPSRSSTTAPSQSRSTVPSISSKPILPSVSSTPCPSRSASRSAPCHESESSRPSRSATQTMECHMTHSSSPSESKPCHQPSPSPSPCDMSNPGKGHGHGPRDVEAST